MKKPNKSLLAIAASFPVFVVVFHFVSFQCFQRFPPAAMPELGVVQKIRTMPDPLRFTHTFTNGATCTFLFEPAVHYDPETRQISPTKHWSRPPTDEEAPALYPEYREWAHTVNSEIAEILDHECTYLFLDSFSDPPSWEFWLYPPSGEPERIKQGTGPFDPRWIGR